MSSPAGPETGQPPSGPRTVARRIFWVAIATAAFLVVLSGTRAW